jgi:ankyrin repeat protein
LELKKRGVGLNPFWVSILFGSQIIFSVLKKMKRGAESVEDENQRIALLCNACQSGSLEDVVHALESCDVNVIDSENGLTPLMYACARLWKDDYETTKEIVHTLIQRGALINAVTFKGSSTLSLAILNGCSTDIVELLIDNKAYVNSID